MKNKTFFYNLITALIISLSYLAAEEDSATVEVPTGSAEGAVFQLKGCCGGARGKTKVSIFKLDVYRTAG